MAKRSISGDDTELTHLHKPIDEGLGDAIAEVIHPDIVAGVFER